MILGVPGDFNRVPPLPGMGPTYPSYGPDHEYDLYMGSSRLCKELHSPLFYFDHLNTALSFTRSGSFHWPNRSDDTVIPKADWLKVISDMVTYEAYAHTGHILDICKQCCVIWISILIGQISNDWNRFLRKIKEEKTKITSFQAFGFIQLISSLSFFQCFINIDFKKAVSFTFFGL